MGKAQDYNKSARGLLTPMRKSQRLGALSVKISFGRHLDDRLIK